MHPPTVHRPPRPTRSAPRSATNLSYGTPFRTTWYHVSIRNANPACMCVSLQRSRRKRAAVSHLSPKDDRDRTGSRHQQAVGVPSILKAFGPRVVPFVACLNMQWDTVWKLYRRWLRSQDRLRRESTVAVRVTCTHSVNTTTRALRGCAWRGLDGTWPRPDARSAPRIGSTSALIVAATAPPPTRRGLGEDQPTTAVATPPVRAWHRVQHRGRASRPHVRRRTARACVVLAEPEAEGGYMWYMRDESRGDEYRKYERK